MLLAMLLTMSNFSMQRRQPVPWQGTCRRICAPACALQIQPAEEQINQLHSLYSSDNRSLIPELRTPTQGACIESHARHSFLHQGASPWGGPPLKAGPAGNDPHRFRNQVASAKAEVSHIEGDLPDLTEQNLSVEHSLSLLPPHKPLPPKTHPNPRQDQPFCPKPCWARICGQPLT